VKAQEKSRVPVATGSGSENIFKVTTTPYNGTVSFPQQSPISFPELILTTTFTSSSITLYKRFLINFYPPSLLFVAC
jgi:hypothetical protein